MGKLPITKKSQTNRRLLERASHTATAEVVTEVFARILDRWTRKELDALVSNKEFVCIDVGKNSFLVGKHTLRKQKDNSWLVKTQTGTSVHAFLYAQAAVFYCLFDNKNQFHRAREFLQADYEIGRTLRQIEEYTHGLKTAIKAKNTFKQDLFLARLSDAQPRLENLKTNMQKTIYGAKYSKVWETKNHETARTRN